MSLVQTPCMTPVAEVVNTGGRTLISSLVAAAYIPTPVGPTCLFITICDHLRQSPNNNTVTTQVWFPESTGDRRLVLELWRHWV
jgi:hypothetical protein